MNLSGAKIHKYLYSAKYYDLSLWFQGSCGSNRSRVTACRHLRFTASHGVPGPFCNRKSCEKTSIFGHENFSKRIVNRLCTIYFFGGENGKKRRKTVLQPSVMQVTIRIGRCKTLSCGHQRPTNALLTPYQRPPPAPGTGMLIRLCTIYIYLTVLFLAGSTFIYRLQRCEHFATWQNKFCRFHK